MGNRVVIFFQHLNEKQSLFLFVGLAFVLRLYAVLMAKGIAYDGAAYGFMARDFLRSGFIKGLSSPLHPFYPFLISLISPDTSHVETAGRIISLVFGTLALIPVYYLAKEVVGYPGAIFAGLFYSFHPYLVAYSGMLLSEATYWGLLILSVYIFWTGLQKGKLWRISLSGIFVGLAYLTRPEGIGYVLVFMAWIIVDGILEKKWFKTLASVGILISTLLILVAPYVIFIHQETGGWLISKKAVAVQTNIIGESEEEVHRPTGGPVEERESGIVRIGKNMIRYVSFTTYHYLRAYHFTLWVFLLFGLIRVEPKWQRGELFIASLVLFHLLSLSTFTDSTIRYSIPLIPVSLLWAGVGVLEMEKYLKKMAPSKAGGWIFIFVILALLLQLPQSLKPERLHRREQKEVGVWLKENTPPGSIIMSNSPQEIFYADREFIIIPEEVILLERPEDIYPRMIEYAKEKRVQYILVDKNTFKTKPDSIKPNRASDLKEIYRRSQRDGSTIFIYEVLYYSERHK
jgi:hypothetical protein